ncbi:MAG: NUDIX domain-containing protein [Cytophagaceae bacterium]|nr:NUDIX domain-containing protein [Cytophagaceae bacterium]
MNETLDFYGQRVRVRVFGLCRQDDRLLLVRHQALLHEGSFWEAPGGGVEFGESLTETVAREFLEETGLVVRVGELRFVSEFRQLPLHAVELFFEVFPETTSALLGHDPELKIQTMQELAWLTWEQIAAIPAHEKHAVLGRVGSWAELMALRGVV